MNYRLKTNKSLYILTDGSFIFLKNNFFNNVKLLDKDFNNFSYLFSTPRLNKNLREQFKYKNKFL